VGTIGLAIWVMCGIATHRWWLIRRTLQVVANRLWPADPDAIYEGQPEEAEVLRPVQVAAPQPPPPPPPPAPQVVAQPRRSRSQPLELPAVIARTRARLLV